MIHVTTKSVGGWGVNENGDRTYFTIPYCVNFHIKNVDTFTDARRVVYRKIKVYSDALLMKIDTIDMVRFHVIGGNCSAGEWHVTDSGETFIEPPPRASAKQTQDQDRGEDD